MCVMALVALGLLLGLAECKRGKKIMICSAGETEAASCWKHMYQILLRQVLLFASSPPTRPDVLHYYALQHSRKKQECINQALCIYSNVVPGVMRSLLSSFLMVETPQYLKHLHCNICDAGARVSVSDC